MASTRFCDSAGVSALAWAHGHAMAKDAKLLLVIPADGAVLRVFGIAGLDRLIPIFADRNEALEQAQAVPPRRLRRQGMPSEEAGLTSSVTHQAVCGGAYRPAGLRAWHVTSSASRGST